MADGVICSLPRQNGQVSTCLRVSRGARSSAFFGRMLRAVATNATGAKVTLDRLVETDLIQQVGRGREGNRYRFSHALVHEVLYQNLLLSSRTELHERAGRELERAVGPHPERLSDLEDRPEGAPLARESRIKR